MARCISCGIRSDVLHIGRCSLCMARSREKQPKREATGKILYRGVWQNIASGFSVHRY